MERELRTPEALGFEDAAADRAARLKQSEDKILGMDIEPADADY